MAKHTYNVEGYPNLTRSTDRIYTHVILRNNRPNSKDDVLTWCGSERLAINQLRKYQGLKYHEAVMHPVQLVQK